jgi:hypothetical protein
LIDVPLTDAEIAKIATATVAAMTKTSSLGDGTNTTPVGNAVFNQGIPNPFNAGKRTAAYVLLGNTGTAVKDLTTAAVAELARDTAQTDLIKQLIDSINAGGGNLDTAVILARIDSAANACAQAVMDTMRRAAQAEAAALEPAADGMTKAIAANPPESSSE